MCIANTKSIRTAKVYSQSTKTKHFPQPTNKIKSKTKQLKARGAGTRGGEVTPRVCSKPATLAVPLKSRGECCLQPLPPVSRSLRKGTVSLRKTVRRTTGNAPQVLLFPKMVRTLGQMIQANKHIAWDIPETPNTRVFFFLPFLYVCFLFILNTKQVSF